MKTEARTHNELGALICGRLSALLRRMDSGKPKAGCEPALRFPPKNCFNSRMDLEPYRATKGQTRNAIRNPLHEKDLEETVAAWVGDLNESQRKARAETTI
jgi:hypothetical protein